MPKPRYKYKCKNCGLPVTLCTKKQKPETWQAFKGDYIHAIKAEGSENFYFMCNMYPQNEDKISDHECYAEAIPNAPIHP